MIGIIQVTPLNADATENTNVAAPFRYKVHVDGEEIGYSEIKFHLDAGEKKGRLTLIRADRKEEGHPRTVIYEDEGVEGSGYKLLILRFTFDAWGIEGPALVFRNCKRR